MRSKRIAVIAMVAAILAVNAGSAFPIATTSQPISIVHAEGNQQALGNEAIECMAISDEHPANPNVPWCFCLTDVTLPTVTNADNETEVIGDVAIGDTWSSTTMDVYPINDGQMYPIKDIFDGLFRDNKDLTSIKLPSGIPTLRAELFRGCSNLTYVESVNATRVEQFAFTDCTNLKSIKTGKLTVIEQYAFDGCSNLGKYSNGVSPIGDSVYSIGNYAFRNCGYDGNISLAAANGDATTIGTGAFEGSSISSVSSLGNAKTIPGNAFKNCKNLTSVKISNTVTKIDAGAFYGCENLTEIEIPDSVTEIDPTAFDGISQIKFKCNAGSFAEAYALSHDNIVLNDDGSSVALDEISSADYFTISASAELNASSLAPQVSANGSILDLSDLYTKHSIKLETIPARSITTGGKKLVIILPDTVSFIDEDAFNLTSVDNITIAANLNSSAYNAVSKYNATAKANGRREVTLITPGTMYAFVNDEPSGNNDPSGTGADNDPSGTGADDEQTPTQQPSTQIPDTATRQLIAPYNAYDFINDKTNYNPTDWVKTANCTITGIDTSRINTATPDKKIIIPETINGTAVTAIGTNAFKGCTWITAVDLPSTVVSIGNGAFHNCTNLKTVTIASGSQLTTIGEQAFESTNVNRIALPESLSTIGREAFAYNDSIIAIELPKYIQSVGNNAFSNCKNLAKANIPDSLKPDSRETIIDAATGEEVPNPAYNMGKIANTAFNADTNLTIYGKTNSYAKTYAEENSIRFFAEDATDIVDDADVMKYISYGNDLFADGIRITSVHDYIVDGKVVSAVPANFAIPEQIGGKDVTTIASNAFKDTSTLTDLKLPDTITELEDGAFAGCESLVSVNIPKHTTKIPDKAFKGCKSLKSIELVAPEDNIEGTLEIGSYAFAGCENLETVTNMPAGDIKDYAFDGCKKLTLTNIKVDNYIGECAFRNCSSLDYMEIATHYTTDRITNARTYKDLAISASAFEGCSNLVKLQLTQRNENSVCIYYIGESAFSGCTSLKVLPKVDKMTSIRKKAFYNCKALNSFTIPATVESIHESAFDGCSSLTNLAFEDNDNIKIYEMGYRALAGTGITEFTIPKNVTEISGYLFADCKKLKTINTHDKINKINSGAFSGCTALESFNMPANMTYIPEKLFMGCTSLSSIQFARGTTGIQASAFENCVSLATVNIPDTVYFINASAFKNSGLTTVTIPTALSNISESTFENCGKLKDVYIIGDKLQGIGVNAFKGCGGLTTINLNDSLGAIKDGAFSYSGLTSIDLSHTNVRSISDNAFLDCKDLTDITFRKDTDLIGANAFAGTGFKDLIIPDTVTSIGSGAFADCKNLETLTIYRGVRTIGEDATKNDTKLTIKGYSGSVANTYAVDNRIPFEPIDEIDDDAQAYSDFYYVNHGSYIEIIGCKPELKGDVTIPDTIEDIPVKQIRANSFANNGNFTSVTIPANVSLGEKAFYNCFNMKSVTLTDTKTIPADAFANCIALESIDFGSAITTIGREAFLGCNSLKTITVPDTLTGLEQACFKNCTNLTSVKIDGNISSIPKAAFYGCERLTSIEVGPNENRNLYKIEDTAFFGCKSLVTCGILNSDITSLGTNAFQDCSALESVDISGITYITPYAFANCSALSSVNTSNSLSTIGANAFQNCKKLTAISIHSTVTNISDYAFDNCDLRTLTLPSSLTSFGKSAFSHNTNLWRVVINDGIRTIPTDAFRGCTNLIDLNKQNGTNMLPNSVSYINSGAFADCPYIGNVRVPKGTTNIYSNAFDEGNASGNSQSNLVLEVYKNSVAHSYAYQNKIKYRIIDEETGQLTDEEPTYYDTPTTNPQDPHQGGTPSNPPSGGNDNNPSSDNPLSEQEAADLVVHDHEQRTGHTVVDGGLEITTLEDGQLQITVTDDGDGSETYIVNPTTGGAVIHSSSEYVNLPQTGITSRMNYLLAFLACIMTGVGAFFVKASGMFRKRRNE